MFDLLKLKEEGFFVIPSFFDLNFINELSAAIDKSYDTCREIQIKNGIGAITDGTVHHLLASDNPVYLNLLTKISESPIYAGIKDFFGGNFIVNSYGGVINLTAKPSYVSKIHRDIRFFSGEFPLMLNMLVMLDDFTLDNGATYLLSGSHLNDEKPSEEEFYKSAKRAAGLKGSVMLFNSNLWHAAGLNKTADKRRAVTITFSKPFMKPQLDYVRAVSTQNVAKLSQELQQMIGFYSRVPSNLDEWYQKPDDRFYRQGQD